MPWSSALASPAAGDGAIACPWLSSISPEKKNAMKSKAQQILMEDIFQEEEEAEQVLVMMFDEKEWDV